MKRVILWFRQDLRLHDNEALREAQEVADEIVPVYVFDERVFEGHTLFGFPKTGQHRARFIRESVADLRANLRELGSDLIVRTGRSEEVLFDLAREVRSSWVFCNRERTPEETAIQDSLERKLWSIGQEVRFSRGKMLIYTSDLPYPVTHTPDAFAAFRKQTEPIINVRKPLPRPTSFPSCTLRLDPGPDIEPHPGPATYGARVEGGETAGLHALRTLIGLQRNLHTEDAVAERPVLSAFLSQGCLSPKRVYHGLDDGKAGRGTWTECVFEGLLRRDHARLMVKKYGGHLFDRQGLTGRRFTETEEAGDVFDGWSSGNTGVPIVDAAMRKLNSTGYIPSGLRYLAARFLLSEAPGLWRLGASYFESTLIDYDPCTNWVNWANLAGVGPDPRDQKPVNYAHQQSRFDPSGVFVRKWLQAGAGLA